MSAHLVLAVHVSSSGACYECDASSEQLWHSSHGQHWADSNSDNLCTTVRPQVVRGVTVPPTAGYTIKMAKPGLTSTRSLVHVNGVAVSTPNLTENGKSVEAGRLQVCCCRSLAAKTGKASPTTSLTGGART
jgi:hypothetical protein